MLSGSPHLYRDHALALGRHPDAVQRAVADMERIESNGLPAILTLGHLSQRTGISYAYLRKIVARRHDPYRTFTISRRSGSTGRPIAVPEPVLMELQRWLLRRVVSQVRPHHASHAYHPGCSIRACAEVHCGATWLVKMDLHDFFTSVKEPAIYDVFLQMGYPPLLSLELARLCTRDAACATHLTREDFAIRRRDDRGVDVYRTTHVGYLPQGAPTSGPLANLVVLGLDRDVSAIAKEAALTYTRYADDIALSGNGRFSRALALETIRRVTDVVRKHGLEVHQRKTRIIPPGARHVVLGLLVDGSHPRLTPQFKSRIRTHIFAVERYGLATHTAARRFTSQRGLINHVDGLLRHAFDIEPGWAHEANADWNAALSAAGWIA